MTTQEQAVLQALGRRQVEAAQLRRITGLSHEQLYIALVALEARGVVRLFPTAGNCVARLWEAMSVFETAKEAA